jgi:hypothetical protein
MLNKTMGHSGHLDVLIQRGIVFEHSIEKSWNVTASVFKFKKDIHTSTLYQAKKYIEESSIFIICSFS